VQNLISTNPCMICGKQRIVVKTYKKYVSGSLTIITKTACPDPLCQKKVNKKLFREDAARERIKSELEKRHQERSKD
jgi:hypothetical protein